MIKTFPRRHAYVWRVPSAGAFQSHAVYHDDGRKKKKIPRVSLAQWLPNNYPTVCDTREFLSMPSDSPSEKEKYAKNVKSGYLFFLQGVHGSRVNRYRKFVGERHLVSGNPWIFAIDYHENGGFYGETSVFGFSSISPVPNSIPMFSRVKNAVFEPLRVVSLRSV